MDVTLLKLGSAGLRTKLKQSGVKDIGIKTVAFIFTAKFCTQKLISEEISYKMLTLE